MTLKKASTRVGDTEDVFTNDNDINRFAINGTYWVGLTFPSID